METMTRKAADNAYLHRDFHNLLNLGIGYIRRLYGPDAVCRYLNNFAVSFYAPLIDDIRARRLVAVEEAFRHTFKIEEASDYLRCERNDEQLFLYIERCPAVEHMQRSGIDPDVMFSATTSVVWSQIAQAANLGYLMLEYDQSTGRAVHLFHEKQNLRQEGRS